MLVLLLFPIGCLVGYLFGSHLSKFVKKKQDTPSNEVPPQPTGGDDAATVAFIEGLKELEKAKQKDVTPTAPTRPQSAEDMDSLATVPVNYFLIH